MNSWLTGDVGAAPTNANAETIATEFGLQKK
jgi:hypothetical protein